MDKELITDTEFKSLNLKAEEAADFAYNLVLKYLAKFDIKTKEELYEFRPNKSDKTVWKGIHSMIKLNVCPEFTKAIETALDTPIDEFLVLVGVGRAIMNGDLGEELTDERLAQGEVIDGEFIQKQ